MNLEILLDFLKNVSIITLNQILSLFGLFFIFGILLYFLSKYTRKVFINSYNYKLDIYLTGWIGVPVHEIGHAVFCIIFGHKINEIKLFQPNSYDGTLGYVNHSYNKRNYYHLIGNFFIGIGPIIFGSIILFLLMRSFVPNQKDIINLLFTEEIQKINFSNTFENIGFLFSFGVKLMNLLLSVSNFNSITFWIFLYISLCVSSHMQLSPKDIKGMLFGLFGIVLLLFVINAISLLMGLNITSLILSSRVYFTFLLGLFFYAIIISVLNFILMYIIFSTIHFIKYKQLLSLR
ncbi:MAG: hypothetical protein AB1695_10690 [Stygiobacter sp.]|jgi:hypothetical protein